MGIKKQKLILPNILMEIGFESLQKIFNLYKNNSVENVISRELGFFSLNPYLNTYKVSTQNRQKVGKPI
jgi:hypothetical protein